MLVVVFFKMDKYLSLIYVNNHNTNQLSLVPVTVVNVQH